MSNNKVMPSPAFSKCGSTNPHNYQATKITASDKARLFAYKYERYSIRTITDILSEVKLTRALNEAKKR